MAIDKYQKKLVEYLKSGKLKYEDASIYTILAELVEGNGIEEVRNVLLSIEHEMKDMTLSQLEELIKLEDAKYQYMNLDCRLLAKELSGEECSSFEYGGYRFKLNDSGRIKSIK